MNGLPSVLGYAIPSDSGGWAALAAVLVVLALHPAIKSSIVRVPLGAWVATCAVTAAGLSIVWIVWYLRGGPRIVDATSYWLEARGMAHGLLSWPVQSPTASFRGRFLLMTDSPAPMLGVIFPPGYPALLAFGFVVGVPLAIGPILAAALVVVTAILAKVATGCENTAKLAALVSTLSACLRYHTADTMSHGLAALCLACALLTGLRAVAATHRRSRLGWWVACGLSGGWLLATRPVSSAALALVGLAALGIALRTRAFRKEFSGWNLVALAAGAALPAALLAMHQRAVTGQWLASSQSAYYLASDGPAGCFRYGFGRGIGCLVEHEPYVKSVLPEGHGLRSALITTGRRLHLHLSDIANAEPIAILAIVGAWWGRNRSSIRLLAFVPVGLALSYVPFYFDGSYPGGGARLLSDGLPAEHVLLAIGCNAWAARGADQARGFARSATAIVVLMLLGFCFRASHQHALLRIRDGGRPLFDPAVVASSMPGSGLLFVGNDHAFNLAHDPSIVRADQGRFVARARGDDRDRLLWMRLGQPRAWRYWSDPWAEPRSEARMESWLPPPLVSGSWRFEAEAEWPPIAQSGGYVAPTWMSPNSCVSSVVALGLVRTDLDAACVTIEVPWPSAQPWYVKPLLVIEQRAFVQVSMKQGEGTATWDLPQPIEARGWPGSQQSPDGRWCVSLPPMQFQGSDRAGALTVCSRERWLAVDAIVLTIPTPQYH